MKQLYILLELAKLGSHQRPCQISSRRIADRIDCSQQTAARWLRKLSEEGFIDREAGPNGQIIELTSKGVQWIKSIEQDIRQAFAEFPENLKMRGVLVSGFNEGGYYVNREEYQRQFREKLGFDPYPGTLDIELDEKSAETKALLETVEGIKIDGFSTQERSFGDVKCFSARIEDEEAAVVLPSRTHHEENIAEIISSVKIRDKYDLEDGDEIEVEVKL